MSRLLDALRHMIGARRAPAPAAAPPAPPERRIVGRHVSTLPGMLAYGFSGIPEPVLVSNISDRGLYLHSTYGMPVGATFELEMVLPAEVASGMPRRVRLSASVVRVREEPQEQAYAIAAAIKHCEVLPPEPEAGKAHAAAATSEPKKNF